MSHKILSELRLERIERFLFRGQPFDPGWGRLYGGHVLGQALGAAQATVGDSRPINSCHSYFIRPGKVDIPIVYDVELIRDGRTMTTRRVSAIQNGKPILFMTASFQIDDGRLNDPAFFEHQFPQGMPDVPPPEDLIAETEHLKGFEHIIPPAVRDKFLGERPIELRPLEFKSPLGFEPCEPTKHVWMRATQALPADDASFQHCVMAYASDLNLIPTILNPFGASPWQREVNCASLDHSIWFHKPGNIFMDKDWILYSIDAPITSRGRGLARGKFFTREGELIASTAQEGMVRRGNSTMFKAEK